MLPSMAENLRTILLETGVRVEPGVTKASAVARYKVYGGIPVGQEWRIPMLTNLIEVRDERWEVNFDDEIMNLESSEVDVMIRDICSH